jgi:hypothetical protein
MTGMRPPAVDRAARIPDDFTMDVDGRVIHLLDAQGRRSGSGSVKITHPQV